MTDAAKAVRVGLFGGTFNPIHLGHLRAAEEVAEALDLERLIFVPSASPPHKAEDDQDVIAPARQRLHWVRLAIADNPRFEVDPLELERAGPSYSVETLRSLAPRLAPERPVFVIGLDAFAEIDTWRDPIALFGLAHFAVHTRPPREAATLAPWLPRCVTGRIRLDPDGLRGVDVESGNWIRLLRVTALDVSASDVRARLRQGRSVRYLLPEAVHEAVVKSGVYSAPQPRGGPSGRGAA